MKTVLIAVAVLGAGVAGYFVGRHAAPAGIENTAEEAGMARPSLDINQATTIASAPVAATPDDTASPTPPPRSVRERIRELIALKSANQRGYEAELFFAGLGLSELPEALESLRALPSGMMRPQLMGALFERWGELDGRGAYAAASHMPGRERWWAEAKAFDGWAQTDPNAAWQAAREAIAENSMAAFRGMGPLREIARLDLNGAMRELSSMTSEMARQQGRGMIINDAFDRGTVNDVMRSALELSAPEERAAWMTAIFQRWGSIDTDAPMTALRSIDDPNLARSAMTGLMSGWSELDPKGALEFALDNRNDPLVAESLSSTVSQSASLLGTSELRDVLQLAQQKGAFDTIASRLLPTISFREPQLALEIAQSLSNEDERTQNISMALHHLARNDFTAAASHYESMPDSQAKLAAFQAVSSAALQQPGRADRVAGWMNQFEGDHRVRAAENLLQQIEFQQRQHPHRLDATTVADLAQSILNTPGLPPERADRARRLLPQSAQR